MYDTIGEIMRFAITGMATGGSIPAGPGQTAGGVGEGRNVLQDLRVLRASLEGLDAKRGSGFLAKDADKKAEVIRTCVEKVENAVYGMIVRGRERPKGWIPDAGGGREGGEEIESY